MASPASFWPWAVACGAAMALALALTGASGAEAGLAAALTVALTEATAWAVGRDALRQVEAYSAAARGELPAEPDHPHQAEPARLALEIQSTAANAREFSRQLAVLRAVIDGMAEGVWITSEDGTVLEHNDALKEMLYAGREIIGSRPRDVLHGAEAEAAELQQAVEKACRESQSSRLELAIEGLRPRMLSVHVSPLGGDLGGSAAVFFDVTELRRLEKVRKDFVANVSHELRTPITAIRGYAETLIDGALQDPATAAKMVDIIHRQSERLSELVEDLLELSRLESRQIQLREAPVDLADAAARALEAVRPKARARNTSVEVLVPPGTFVLGDQRAVEQIVLNLLDNAVKYTPSNGRVWISAQREGDQVVMRVRDDGLGIEARHLPRLFERFYRVDKGRSRDMGGTGLGLSIVKHLATAMKGDVSVNSTPGQGSTFSVTLKVPQPGDFDRPQAAPEAG